MTTSFSLMERAFKDRHALKRMHLEGGVGDQLKEGPVFNFMTTGVGSVPFSDVDDTCRRIIKAFPDMPFWPQFVKRSYLEDMLVQASEGLPFLEVDHKARALAIRTTDSPESELIPFYEHFLATDTDYFAISEERAIGLYTILDLMENGLDANGSFIKGQIVGPITLGGSLKGPTGKSALYDGEIMTALVKGLAIKALWLIRKMAVSGRVPILFIDEPYLSGFGSAFTPIRREEVIRFIGEIVDYLRSKSDIVIGIHCCGNTDWSMIIETGVDIVNFDAFGYMDYFLLYRDEIIQFVDDGGTVAWGVIPTTSFTGKEAVTELKAQLEKGLDRLYEWGIKRDRITERSIITPACGLGTLEPQKAEKVLELLSSLSNLFFEIAG
jgi:hypothetical protein